MANAGDFSISKKQREKIDDSKLLDLLSNMTMSPMPCQSKSSLFNEENYTAHASGRAVSKDQYSEHGLKCLERPSRDTIFKYANCFSTDYNQYLENTKLKELGKADEDAKCPSMFRDAIRDLQLLIEMEVQKSQEDYQHMLAHRQTLPAYQMKEAIIDLIDKNKVIVLVGETGCGKTTQVPQYILDSYIDSRRGSLCKIICTQPRRISAIGVAQRVAAERCVPCGEMGPVGYHIRLESKRPRQHGSILFCTTGILLVQLQINPYLSGISHVIVDEVHERDQLSDFLLMCLQDIIKVNTRLKVILMSATVNAKEFSAYFGDCPIIEIPGRMFAVKSYFLEHMLDVTGYIPKPKQRHRNGKKHVKLPEVLEYDKAEENQWNSHSKRFSPRIIEILRNWDSEDLHLDLIAKMLMYICSKRTVGTILVFLPGWKEITALLKMIQHDFPQNKFLIIPLHSQTAKRYEKQVLNRAPSGIRKIILATNIAETSITIDDCTIVIDSGKFKQNSFDPVKNMHVLEPQWVTLSNVKQRRGRAGRTQPGESYHMFTSLTEEYLKPYQVPEMQRCSLEQLILNIKILKQCRVVSYFERALSPPKPEAVEASLKMLRRLKAINADEILTPLGFLLAKLPVDVQVGKMLLYGAIFSCLDPITSIAACLSFKEPFNISVWSPHEADIMKLDLADGEQSDHMLFVKVLQKWRELEDDSDAAEDFCYEYFLSAPTLRVLMNMKKQFSRYLKQLHFLAIDDEADPANNFNSGNILLIKGIICSALYPNIAEVCPRGYDENPACLPPLRAKTAGNNIVSVHPKSVNTKANIIGTGWLAYHMIMKSTKVYIHDTTDVHPYYLLLFANEVEGRYEGRHYVLRVDDWLKFAFSKSETPYVLVLKEKLDYLLKKKFLKPSFTNWDCESYEIEVLECVVDYITDPR